MLDYNIIKNKQIVKNNNIIFYDLLSSSININEIPYQNTLIVSEYYVARPDLISFAIYGTDEYADIICKINGISNPFELNKGMVINIPNISFIDRYLNENNFNSEFITNENKNIFENLENVKKYSNEKRSPNNQLVGEENFIIDKSLGVIFY